MKNNRIVKIVTLILSALLLIGAAVGISVSAEGETTVKIAYKNLAYESAPRLVYYVDAQNVAEGDTVKVLLYDEEPTEVTVDGATAVESFGTLSVEGKDYLAFSSEEIAPKNMRLSVWAAPVVIGADGAIVAYGDVIKYSVFDYAIDRFSMAPAPDQLALYTALLDFGGAVQEVLYEQGKYTDEDLAKAGGLANMYYLFRNDVTLDGEVVASSEVTSHYEGASVTLTAERSYGEGGIFKGFLDPDGARVGKGAWIEETVYVTKPGYNVFETEYTVTGSTYNTFDDFCIDGSENDVNTLYKGKSANALRKAVGIYGLVSNFGNEKTATTYTRIDVDSDNSENQVFAGGTNGTAGGTSFGLTLDAVSVGAEKYVVQFDFKWDGRTDKEVDTSTGNNPIFFRAGTSATADPYDLVIVQLSDFGSSYDTYKIAGYELNKGDWVNVRFEFTPHSTTRYSLTIFFDGVAGYTVTNTTPVVSQAPAAALEVNKFFSFRAYMRMAKGYSYELDNAYIGVEMGDCKDEGAYFNDTETTGAKYDYDELEKVGTDNVFYHMTGGVDKKIDLSGDTLRFAGKDPNGGFSFRAPENTTGGSYVFETDFKFNSMDTSLADGSDVQIAWFGMSGSDEPSKTNCFLPLVFNGNANNGKIESLDLCLAPGGKTGKLLLNILPGYWYNIRLVYTPNNVTNDDGTVTYGGYVEIFVNGNANPTVTFDNGTKKATATYQSATSGYVTDGSISNELFTAFTFEFRSTQWAKCTNIDIEFDNTYVGAIKAETEDAE